MTSEPTDTPFYLEDAPDVIAGRLARRPALTRLFFFQAEDGIRERDVTGVQTCALPISAWIPWTFQKENTMLDGKVEEAGGFEYLKTLAVSRLYLDNVRNVQGSWVTQGPKIGQISLSFGADDLGSIMIEENVVYAAGARNRMTQEEMRRLIADAGYEPVQRRTLYDACEDLCCAAPIPVPKPRPVMLPTSCSALDNNLASA